jgi:hypothetical protein
MKKHFILFVFLAIGMACGAQTPWNGTVAETYNGGSGTAEKPYEIATAEQLALLAYETNNGTGGDAYYILTDDICLNGSQGYFWPPIGMEPFVFMGSFDGDNHTISDLYVYNNMLSGLFGGTRNAVIKNVQIDNSTISMTILLESSCIGFIAGKATDTSITDCIVNGSIGSITNNLSYNTGGIVGEFVVSDMAEDTIVIRNCENYAEISGFLHVGGIAGFTTLESNKMIMEGCVNHGDLSYITVAEVGGMIGRGNFIMRNCENYGRIDGNSTGGMVGHGNGFGIMTYCINHESGEVRGECAGGIIGTAINTIMSMCVNKAPIIGDKGNTTFVGGIAGANGSFSNCYNRGDISIDLSNNIPGAVQMGGISSTPANGSIFNVYNTGAVVKVDHPNVYSQCYGIIIPVIQSDTLIGNCYWFGDYDVPPCQFNVNNPGSPVSLPGSCPFNEGATSTTWILDEAQYGTTDLIEALNLGAMGECVWVEDIEMNNDGFPVFGVNNPSKLCESASAEITVYPNPGGNTLNIRTGLQNTRVEVYDTNGRLIHRQVLTENVTGIDATDWAKGIYVWKVYTGVSTGSTTLAETGKWVKE